MAITIGLVPYAVRIWDKNEHDYCQLDNLPLTTSDFFLILENYLNERRTEKSVDSNKKCVIKVDRLDSFSEDLSIDGLFKSGTYGFSSELENLNTGVIRNRSVNDCEYLPIYYSFQLKPGQNEAILLLQKFGITGVKTTLLADFSAYIDAIDSNLRLEINPLVSDSHIQELVGGAIKKLGT